jgi:hypothetical protein
MPLACHSLFAQVDTAVAMAFYCCGIAFNLAQQPAFRNAMMAVAAAGPGYRIPSKTRLSTTLLTTAKRQLEEDLTPLHESYAKFGYTIGSDGWTDTTNRCANTAHVS